MALIAKTQHSDVLLITRVLSVVDWCLKHQFPDNYDARCMYSAFGASTMLNEAGLVAQIITGDVYAFTVTPSGDQAIIHNVEREIYTTTTVLYQVPGKLAN